MTHDEMALELRNAGWRVEEPLTQANCRHPNKMGSGGVSADGSGFSTWHCGACGASGRSEWGPSQVSNLDYLRVWR